MPPDPQRGSKGLFFEGIKRVISQVHAVLTISNEAMLFLDLQLFQLLTRICSSTFTTTEELRRCLETVLPEEIASWAVREAEQILTVSENLKNQGTTSKRSTTFNFEGLAFPVEMFAGDTFFLREKVDFEVQLYLTAALEYVAADILKLAGNYAENHHRKTIDVGDIRATLRLDSVLQELFVRVRSDLLFDMLIKQEEKLGRCLSLILKVIADVVKPVKEHAMVEIFQMCQKIMEFHKAASKITADAVGFQGVVQFLEHLIANRPLFQAYSKEFEKAVPEIENWRSSPQIKKLLDENELGRSVEHHLKHLLWQPFDTALSLVSSLTFLLHLMPSDQTLLQLTKELAGFGADLTDLAKKYDCEVESDQDWRSGMWRHLEYEDLQSKIEGWTGKNIWEYETRLYKEGSLGVIAVQNGIRKEKKPKERTFWLFDKMLVSAKPADFLLAKKGYFYELKEVLQTNSLSIRENVPDLEEAKNAFELVKDENSSLIVVTKTEKERGEWLAAFNREISYARLAYALEKVLMHEAFQGPELPPSLRLTVEQYPFAAPDTPECILFEINDSGGIPLIKGGTVLKLVERLTFDKYADTNYLLQFLLTYRSFMQPMELLDLLIERFNYPTPPNASGEELEYFKQNIKRPVQLRVFNVLRNWVDKHYLDFQESKELLKRFLEFVNNDMSNVEEMNKALSSLSKAIRKKREEESEKAKRKPNLSGPNEVIPEPIRTGITGNGFIDLMDLDPIEVARQLTLIEDKYYKAIPSYECLNQRWAKKNKEKEAPHILVMIDRFNKVSNWVKTFVVFRREYQTRVEIIEKFIAIAAKCMELNNYNAMTEIISGLNSIPVNRLKQTWAGVSKKSMQTFQEMAQLMAPEKNYSRFRKHLHTRDPPCIPYFGVYLTDLTFIEDGNKDLIPGTDLINFSKRRKIAAVITEIQQYQQLWYKFQEIPELIDYLTDLHIEEDEDCYQKSLEIEPRQTMRTNSDGSTSVPGSGERSSIIEVPEKKTSEQPFVPPKPERKQSFPTLSYSKSITSFSTMLNKVSNVTSNALSKLSENVESKTRSPSHSVGSSVGSSSVGSPSSTPPPSDPTVKGSSPPPPLPSREAKPKIDLADFESQRNSTVSTRSKSDDDIQSLTQSRPEMRERVSSQPPPVPYRDRSNLH